MRNRATAASTPEDLTVSDLRADGSLDINAATDSLLEYLKAVRDMRQGHGARERLADYHYIGMEDFLLQHGRLWTPRPLPTHIPTMTPNRCFDNCWRLINRRKSLRYVEGIAMGIIPVHHAWCVDDDDNVIDPTWASTNCELGDLYFGVTLPVSVVRDARNNAAGCVCVLNNYGNRWKLFRQPYVAVC